MRKKPFRTRGLAMTLAAATALAAVPVSQVRARQESAQLPTPVYSWDFESDDVSDAALEGEASIVKDRIKGRVLNLPGGSVGAGSMTLPQDLFENLGDEGFTISMWVKASSDTGAYTKIFDASNSPLGATYDGGNNWSCPDFALAAGGNVYDLTLYVGEAGKSTENKSKICYDTHLLRDAWQHMTVSVSPQAYRVYINGEEITYQDAQQGTKKVTEVLPSLFADGYLASLQYASIGKSFYTSDNDFCGQVDDVQFYGEALEANEAKELFESYGEIDTTVPPAEITVDMAESTGAVKHGATGFLYGLGEDDVPNVNLLTAIKPYMCEQKPADGLQHPNGDILNIADTFLEAGGDSIQIACPDIYANWPYEFESIPEYLEKLKEMVRQVKEAGLSERAVYVPFNEPNGNWYGNITDSTVQQNFFSAWKQAYDAIKSVDPNAKIAGTNLTHYIDSHMKAFVQFCAQNDCIPDQITWHVLNDGLYNSFPSDVAKFRSYEKQYWIDAGKTTEEKEIVINEYADFTHLGVPGQLARWIGLFEDEKVTACLAYWHISNNLDDLAADNNEPNGAWWLYKWYGEMSGDTLSMKTAGLPKTQLYGVASLDENKKSANVIFGGADGKLNVTLEHVDQTESFSGKVKVKLESTSWTGINGAADEPVLVREEIYPVDEDGSVTIPIEDMVAASAYNITVTQAGDEDTTGVCTEGPWRQTYEAEDAILAGNARKAGKDSRYACSGTGQAQYIDDPGDSVTFRVEVPRDGYYKFDMVYGAATGNNTSDTSSNDPKNAVQELYVDGEKSADMLLENTLTWYMSGMHTEYVYLKAGSHDLKVEATKSEGKATLDCMYLTFVGDEEALYRAKNVKEYEAELSDFNVLGEQTSTTVSTDTALPGYSASGYVTGLDTPVTEGGGIRFTVCVAENGMYKLTADYAAQEEGSLNFYLDNTALTLDNLIASETAQATDGAWGTVSTVVFLQKGINIIDLDAQDASMAVDKLTVEREQDQSQITVIEAEDCKTFGNVAVGSNSYASGGKYVKQILASAEGKNGLLLEYDALEAGDYRLVIYQSNKELFGNHSYNAQMVDRFVTLSVNGGEPQQVFFRNTYSDEAFKSQVATVTLKEGANTIQIYNDDSRTIKNGVGGVNTCVNYTPNLDKFEITSAVRQTNVPQIKPADSAVLELLVKAAAQLREADYTKESYQAFASAYQAARELLGENPSLEQQEKVDEALENLAKAMANLEPSGSQSVPKANTAGLQEAVNQAEKLVQTEYTEESYTIMARALAVAKALLNGNPDQNLQAAVDAGASALNSSVAGLTRAVPQKGTKTEIGGFVYRVTKSSSTAGTVALVKSVKKNRKAAVIPSTVNIAGYSFRVTSIEKKAFANHKKLARAVIGSNVKTIGARCFKGCGKLKKLQVKSKALSKVGKSALQGVPKKAVIKVPAKKRQKYGKLFGRKVR